MRRSHWSVLVVGGVMWVAIGAGCDDEASGGAGAADTLMRTSEVATEIESETVSEIESETETVSETEIESETETEIETEIEIETVSETVTETVTETEVASDSSPPPFDYPDYQARVAQAFADSGSADRHCATTIPAGPIPADAGARVPIGAYLRALTGATTAETTVAECGPESFPGCPAIFEHDVMGQDGILAAALSPLADELATQVTTTVYRFLLHATAVDYDAIVIAGVRADTGEVVGLAFVNGLAHCGAD